MPSAKFLRQYRFARTDTANATMKRLRREFNDGSLWCHFAPIFFSMSPLFVWPKVSLRIIEHLFRINIISSERLFFVWSIFRLFDIINFFIGRPAKAIQWLRHFHRHRLRIKSINNWHEASWSNVLRIFYLSTQTTATAMRLTMYSFLTSIVIKMKKRKIWLGTARSELEACSQIGRSTLTQHAREPNLSPLEFLLWILLPFTQRQRAFY